jgi:hypothetical protein
VSVFVVFNDTQREASTRTVSSSWNGPLVAVIRQLTSFSGVVIVSVVKSSRSYVFCEDLAHNSSECGSVVSFIQKLMKTERRGRAVNTPSYSGGPGFKSWPGDSLSWRVFRRFTRSLQADSGIAL